MAEGQPHGGIEQLVLLFHLVRLGTLGHPGERGQRMLENHPRRAQHGPVGVFARLRPQPLQRRIRRILPLAGHFRPVGRAGRITGEGQIIESHPPNRRRRQAGLGESPSRRAHALLDRIRQTRWQQVQGQRFQPRGRGGIALQTLDRGGIEQEGRVLEPWQDTGRPNVATQLPGGDEPVGQGHLRGLPSEAHEVGQGIGQPAPQPCRLDRLPGRGRTVGQIEGATRSPAAGCDGLQLVQSIEGFSNAGLKLQDRRSQPVRQSGLRCHRHGCQRPRQFAPGLGFQFLHGQRWQQGQGRHRHNRLAHPQRTQGQGTRVLATARRRWIAGEQATPQQPVGPIALAGIELLPQGGGSRAAAAGRRQGTHDFAERTQHLGWTTRAVTGTHAGQKSDPHLTAAACPWSPVPARRWRRR